MNRSMIISLLLPLAVTSGCREVCTRDELRHGDRCVPRPDAGEPEDSDDPSDAGDGLDSDTDADDVSLEDAQIAGPMEDGSLPPDAAAPPDLDACTNDANTPACPCPDGFYREKASCLRGSIDVAAGMTACSIQTDGTLWCWGGDARDSTPKQVGTGQGWQQIESAQHVLFLWFGCGIRDGDLYCWGDISPALLGLGTSTTEHVQSPTRIGSNSDWQMISPGYTGLRSGYACGIRSGQLYCWGNKDGLLGTASTADVLAPARVGPRSDWTTVSAGGTTACGIADGELWCWTHGSPPTKTTDWTDWTHVSAGFRHACAIRRGEMYCWGDNEVGAVGAGADALDTTISMPIRIGNDDNWEGVSASADSTCAIRAGELYCWGSNFQGVFGLGSSTPSPTRVGEAADWRSVSVAAGRACGTHSDGQVECWGVNSNGEIGRRAIAQDRACAPRLVGTAKDWTAIAAGQRYTCGIRSRELYCWGQLSSDGELLYEPTRVGNDTDWQSISLHPYQEGGSHACGIRANKLYCWGGSASGQLGTGDADLGLNPRAPIQVGDSNWSEVSVGWGATCARSGGDAFCWGSNPLTVSPQLQTTPQAIPDSHWSQLSTGVAGGTSCGLRAGGHLWCWQGVGPVQMLDELQPAGSWTQVSRRSATHTCGIQSRQVYCWGRNGRGELGLGTVSNADAQIDAPSRVVTGGRWIDVSTREGASCGIQSNWGDENFGSLWCWGDRAFLGLGDCEEGAIAEPTQIPGEWSKISLGAQHGCALATDGGLWCWGMHWEGATGHGPFWAEEPAPIEWALPE